MVIFSKKLRQLRKENKLTQAELGTLIGVKHSIILLYELRERIPSPAVIKKLAATLHVSADYLLGIEKQPSIDVSGLDESDIALVRSLVDTLQYKNARN
ncbi:MAG: helix-turn-helix transcriptional regulator [Peptococcaceae bacterium]|nr:helix-turn-helix transcriptional regulator [Peptococcaceae bacterium]